VKGDKNRGEKGFGPSAGKEGGRSPKGGGTGGRDSRQKQQLPKQGKATLGVPRGTKGR